MATKTYVVQVALADLADHYANGKNSPDIIIADTLFTEGQRVLDVTSYRDGFQITTTDTRSRLGNEFYTDDATEWFVTTSKAIRDLGA